MGYYNGIPKIDSIEEQYLRISSFLLNLCIHEIDNCILIFINKQINHNEQLTQALLLAADILTAVPDLPISVLQ